MIKNLQILRNQIAQVQFLPQSVQLIAVSKNISISNIIAAYNAGQTVFAENYAQELISKVQYLQEYAIEWHFIGKLQSNKIKQIAPFISWVHSIENAKQILMLNKYRDNHQNKLNILIEVNLDNDNVRSGVTSFNDIVALIELANTQKNIMIRGLMGVASNTSDINIIKNQFTKLYEYKNKLNTMGYNLDSLSMGMSNDYEIALQCGSTMLRIGSLIFGDRVDAK